MYGSDTFSLMAFGKLALLVLLFALRLESWAVSGFDFFARSRYQEERGHIVGGRVGQKGQMQADSVRRKRVKPRGQPPSPSKRPKACQPSPAGAPPATQ